MRLLVKLTLLVLGQLAASLAQAQVVKCVDVNGRVEYSKVCPTGSTEAGRIQRDAMPTPSPAPRGVPAPTGYANPADIGPDRLDNAEDNVCGAAGRLAGAKAGLADKGSVPVEKLAGQQIDDPSRRQALQQTLDASLQSTQRDMVAASAKELAKYQAEYRRLTGAEFNTALCDDKQRRIKRQEAWEIKRREDQMDKAMSNEADGVRAICRQKQFMDGPSKDAASWYSAEQVKDMQEMGREGYAGLVASYERTYNTRFDPARCR
jgi:hypothetical protein